MPFLKTLVGFEHEKYGFNQLHPSVRKRLEEAKHILDRHEQAVVGLELCSEKTLLRLGQEALPRHAQDERRPLNEGHKKKLAKAIAHWSSLEGREPPQGHEEPLIRQAVNRFRTFADFVHEIESGYFSTFEAMRVHAEKNNQTVIPLDDANLAREAGQALEIGGGFGREERQEQARRLYAGEISWEQYKQFTDQSFRNFDARTVYNRDAHMIQKIQLHKPEVVIIGESHAQAVENHYKIHRIRIVTPWSRLVNGIRTWILRKLGRE